jgi:hypothetical protein
MKQLQEEEEEEEEEEEDEEEEVRQILLNSPLDMREQYSRMQYVPRQWKTHQTYTEART